MNTINHNIEQAALRSGRTLADIMLVAVSKTVDIEIAKKAHQLGIDNFGENRTREFVFKQQGLPEAKWHFIGHLQTNKIRDVIGRTHLIHSLDRWRLAEEINKASRAIGQKTGVLLQVNISGEKRKYGLKPDEVENFLADARQLEMISIKGFMTMAPLDAGEEEIRGIFREMARIRKTMLKLDFKHCDLKYVSMGMSQDYEIAIEEGANIVRIGSSLFDT